MRDRAVVLLSGGLDSSTCVGLALDRGFEVVALSFFYGQRHQVELEAARRIVQHYGLERHTVVDLDVFREMGGSALTGDVDVPRHARVQDLGVGIQMTYVPGRNLVFLSHAVALAEVTGARDVFIGVNALDYSGYPDCRPEFIRHFEATANLATRVGVEGGATHFRICAPLVDLSKADIIRLGTRLEVPYELTHSCYDPPEARIACGHCDSCLLRIRGFEEAGMQDPISYTNRPVEVPR